MPRRLVLMGIVVALGSSLPACAGDDDRAGEVHDAQGRPIAAGARVEGVIGATVCGVAELRATGYYIMSVVGQDTIAGCADGDEIRFRVDGRFANESSAQASANAHLNLTTPAP